MRVTVRVFRVSKLIALGNLDCLASCMPPSPAFSFPLVLRFIWFLCSSLVELFLFRGSCIRSSFMFMLGLLVMNKRAYE